MLLVVSVEFGGFRVNLLENFIDVRLHKAYGSLPNTYLGVELFEDSLDLNFEGIDSPYLQTISSLVSGVYSTGEFASFLIYNFVNDQ